MIMAVLTFLIQASTLTNSLPVRRFRVSAPALRPFIGPAAAGELNTPTKITSWDRFREVFGEQPLPGFFLWYAVRGFFENGGQSLLHRSWPVMARYDEIVLEHRNRGNGAPGNPSDRR
jgi:hypothetical protein